MKAISLILISILLFYLKSTSQQTVIVTGSVRALGANEHLGGATVIYSQQNQSILSNDAGFFSIKVKKNDSCTLIISFMGYDQTTLRFIPINDTAIDIFLPVKTKMLRGVEVTAVPGQTPSRLSAISIPAQQLEKIPAFLGEKDIIKTLQLLPGIQSGNEASTGYHVRGGSPDQNLILVDGTTVYNISHLFGFFSLFPPEAVSDVRIYKGAFPSRYGGRLSSVLDIKLREGDQNKYTGSISAGLISGKFSLEGPIKKNKSSFFISGRRTYVDLLTAPFFINQKARAGYFFYDGVAKLNFQINKKNRLFLSAYNGKDRFYTSSMDEYSEDAAFSQGKLRTGFGWGNSTLAMRWTQIVSPNLHFNYGIHASQFRYQLDFQSEGMRDTAQTHSSWFDYSSGVCDWVAKWDADWYFSNEIKFRFGLSHTRHRFIPFLSRQWRLEDGLETSAEQSSRSIISSESVFYLESDISLTKRLQLNAGLHNNLYHVDKKNFLSVQPRINGSFRLPDSARLLFGYAFMQQPVHLLTNNGPGLPTDLWVPATSKVTPQRAWQYSAGYKRPVANYEFSAEVYYKLMKGVIEYREGANFINANKDWEENIERGNGESYGIELFAQRKTGRLSGWAGYTLSWNKRQFLHLNEGRPFYYKYDRRHDLKIVLVYDLKKNVDLSLSFLINSGNRITLPTIFYEGAPAAFPYRFPDLLFDTGNIGLIYHSEGRNNLKMKTYHRADASINFHKEKKKGIRTWNISVYNLYSRQNPYYYYYRQYPGGRLGLRQVSLFPIIPSITYSFKWN